MSSISRYRGLLWAVAALFALGHAHQILGQFETHHHHGFETHIAGDVHHHEGGEHHEDQGDPGKDADHMAGDHASVGVVPAQIVGLVIAAHPVALVDLGAEAMPDAPVAGIDHPPQVGA